MKIKTSFEKGEGEKQILHLRPVVSLIHLEESERD
jgi:hypothetical protein